MPKVLIMRGLPGSGKTTIAKEKVKDSGYTYTRVNRDDLRLMLHDSYWSAKNESTIIEAEKSLIASFIEMGKSVIIDDTNLTEKTLNMWKDFCVKHLNVQYEILDLTKSTSVKFCVINDAQREKSVGAAVIYGMALRNNLINWDRWPFANGVVIFDIDGTLSNPEHRLHFVNKEPKNWNEFFNRCDQDSVNTLVRNWINRCFSEEIGVLLVSGRPTDRCQFKTLNWLNEHSVSYDGIFMRNGGDYRSDVDVKNEILSKIPKEKILFAVDDRPQVIEGVWRANGIKCYPVTQTNSYY